MRRDPSLLIVFVHRAFRLGALPYLAIASLAILVSGALPPSGAGREAAPPPSPTIAVGSAGSSSLREDLPPLADSAAEERALVAEPTAAPTPEPTAAPPPPRPAVAPLFDVPSSAVAILEAPCGALLYGKDEHASLPPASLTKIITALAAINHVNLGDRLTSNISAKELKKRTRSSVMGLEPGMTVTVRDLLYGLFLPSGNDASIVLAEHVSGSVDAFLALMNEEAARIGMKDSRFSNPHGLDSPGLRSSAYDMALAGMALMQNPTLAQISSARTYTLEGGLQLRNGNKLLNQYSGAYGVKIGYTNRARHTIVAAAARGDRDIYVAVFGSEDLYNETAALLDWAFSSTERAC
jgi:D-alanyl-D-alanine carboxypeptidase